LIERLAAEYRPRAAETGLSLRLAPCSLRARADREMVERILRNLLENALRYTPQGGILLGVRRRGENVRLDVIDTGIGIAANKQTVIFEEFRQLNNPARDASQGLGLGLAIVDRLARLMGTRVEVASHPGRGSRFSLLLPLDRDGSAAAPVKSALDDCGGRILVIEDNSGLRQAYEMMLNDWGYTTFGAATGEEAIRRAAQEKWLLDAIVADHRLGPGLTGAEAAAEIARCAGRDFPTLIVTGDTARERITEIHASGFAMLHKPVEAAELRRRLAQGLAQGMRAAAVP
jgi:CheY-like chemotaxis protein